MARKVHLPRRELITVRFTGAAGASQYSYDDGRVVLNPGDERITEPAAHWDALLASGNAEVVPE